VLFRSSCHIGPAYSVLAIAVNSHGVCSWSLDTKGAAYYQHYVQEPENTLACLESVMAVLRVEVLEVFLARYGP
jgi:hypothetical protein